MTAVSPNSGAFRKYYSPATNENDVNVIMESDSAFPGRSFVLAHLLLDPIYREEGSMWETLRAERDAIAHYFRQIGQEVVIDEGEGYAFLRQIEPGGGERVPRGSWQGNLLAIQQPCCWCAFARSLPGLTPRRKIPRDLYAHASNCVSW